MTKLSTLILAAVSFTVLSCGKNNVIHRNDPTEPSLTEPANPEDAQQPEGNGEENPEGNGGQNPEGNGDEKPDAALLARRATLRVRPGVQIEDSFDLYRLWLTADRSAFTPQYLSQYVEFYSTSFEGKEYRFTEADLQECEVKDISYQPATETVSFYLRYKQVLSERPLSFSVKKAAYFAAQVKVKPHTAERYYAQGVKEHPDLFGHTFITYDESRYVMLCQGITLYSGSDTKLYFSYEVCRRGSEQPIAQFVKPIDGFRPLARLAEELLPMQTIELRDYLSRVLDLKHLQGDVTELLRRKSTLLWIPLTEFHIATGQMSSEKLDWENGSLTGLYGPRKDVYLQHPRFEVAKAVITDTHPTFLNITLRLTYVNESSPGDDCLLAPLSIHIVR